MWPTAQFYCNIVTMYVDPDDGGLRTWNPTGTLMSKNLPNIFVDEDDDCGDHCGQESC
jgi:hypothetical protein